jgi:5-methyltetrahydrofolate--homocysteine methyltransferase
MRRAVLIKSPKTKGERRFKDENGSKIDYNNPTEREFPMSETILDLVEKRTVLLDGGFGSELIRRGLTQGICPEGWNIEKPEIIQDVHKGYFEAGSDAVLTNSFGGSRIRLASHGVENRTYELNRAGADLAVQVKPNGKFVGGSVGPTGKFLKPHGKFTEEEFEEAYVEQARGLADGGVDFILIETQYDLREALCALRAVRRTVSLPTFVTLTFKPVPRGFFTLMGDSIARCVDVLGEEGVPVVGANCTVGAPEMAELIKEMRSKTDLPLIAQANAGQPTVTSEGIATYTQTPEDYVASVPRLIENGANIIGGCCGTNDEHIRLMAGTLGIT